MRCSLHLSFSCHLQPQGKDEQKYAFLPFIRCKKLFCFGSASFCHSQSLFFSRVFWELFISCQTVEEKAVLDCKLCAPYSAPQLHSTRKRETESMASCRNAALYSLPWLNIPRKGITQRCGALECLLAIVLQRMQAFRVKLKQRWILGKLVFRSELHRLELFPVCITTHYLLHT